MLYKAALHSSSLPSSNALGHLWIHEHVLLLTQHTGTLIIHGLLIIESFKRPKRGILGDLNMKRSEHILSK